MSAQQKPFVTEEFARHIDSGHKMDTSETYNQVLALRDEIWQYISTELNFSEDLGCQDIHNFNDLQGNHLGRMRNFTGDNDNPVDWVIHSDIGQPQNTFTNIHLTFWMKGNTDVPHLGMAFGTLPEAFYYVDMMPRYELVTHPEHVEKYYDAINDVAMAHQNELFEHGVKPFNAAMPFIRASLSPCAVAGVGPLSFFENNAKQKIWAVVKHWLELVKNAQQDDDQMQCQKRRQRDYDQRRSIVYLDPANPIAERLVGKQAADRLIRILAGEERNGKPYNRD
ncbi:hypothetical protein E2K93_09105 [Thalassotalea sp. HSM 43]|uniref:hypothetical protein n=1 Tax=Thalassotalea sp. HSM 43 TaxID=2552945 RepID=UPI00108160C6|nr:hypothetical protein [Thalassotalea sp. HSM 43]QBY04537.1 hypothetical protein E2K93_09105 [Thalassotalea sp. HSM 43]